MDLSIIIVNYNVKHLLEQCLLSVQKAIAGISAEVIVIDNASTDDSMDYLAPLFPWVKFTWNNENAGYARANNMGLKEAAGNYILFLNPDTILKEDTLQKSIAFMNADPRAGALGIKMYNGEGIYLPESKRGFPSPFYKLSGITALFPRSPVFARYYLGHLDENSNQEVEVLSGAFMLTRKDVLQQTGGFDERFFMYAEDIDLSYRIQQAGYKNYYLAESSIVHFKGASTNQESLRYTRLFYKAMNQFVKKHYTGSRSLVYIAMIQTGITLRAGLSGIRNLFRQIKKRTFTNRQNK
jgi:GT2 family glycosyltransferase